MFSFFNFLKDFIYLFLDRRKGWEKEERNINVWLPLTHPLVGTLPATQACFLTGNWTSDPLVCRPALNPLSHTNQGQTFLITGMEEVLQETGSLVQYSQTFCQKYFLFFFFLITVVTLAMVAQLAGCGTVNQNVTSSVPGQGTCLGHRLHALSLVGHLQKATNWCFSLTSMFLSLTFSLLSHLSKRKRKINLKNYNGHFGLLRPQQDMGWAPPVTCYSSYTTLKLWELFVLNL